MYHVLPVLLATIISSTIGHMGDNGEKVHKLKSVAVTKKCCLGGNFENCDPLLNNC
jgi:hypothetical protein